MKVVVDAEQPTPASTCKRFDPTQEKAMEGMPSSAASHAAPLYIVVSGYLGYVFWRLTLFQTPGR